MSLRDEILDFEDLETREIIIKQWGNKKILVKTLTAEKRYELIESCMQDNKKKLENTELDGKKLYIYTIIACTFDPQTDKPIFTFGDYDKLKNKNSGAIDSIVQVANELNGFGDEEIKDAEKNSNSGIPKDDSILI